MATARVRRDIWSLEHEKRWHPITTAYALAVRELKTRDEEDPTSWRYQAAIHGVPRGVVTDKWRNQCQHTTWFFLPWHRLYLFWFERIVLKAMEKIDEIPPEVRREWALPYWNYSRQGSNDYAKLPDAFKAKTMENGDPNPLFVKEREPRINDDDPVPAAAIRELAYFQPVFSLTQPRVVTGFGGPKTGWHHLDEPPAYAPGMLELIPHGTVHGEVGGLGGFMSDFPTAPLDPIFWLHHANIDRMWVAWLTQPSEPPLGNPSDRDWSNFPFHFHDEEKREVQSTPAQAVRTEDLGYTYEDATVPADPRRRRSVTATQPPPDEPPELAGANDAPLRLAGQTERIPVPLAVPEGLVRRRGPAAKPERVYLNLEQIEGEKNPGVSYAVYINVPEGETEDLDSYHVGTVGFFGIEHASDLDVDHPGGHGLQYAFDITDVVETLRNEARWNPGEVTVTITPSRPAVAEVAPVQVGRVSIYYQ